MVKRYNLYALQPTSKMMGLEIIWNDLQQVFKIISGLIISHTNFFYVGDIFEIFDYFKDNFKRIGHFQRQNFLQNIITLLVS